MSRGFSLVEVVVALLIFQVGVLATMTLTLSALETLRTAEEIERAVTALRLVADSIGTRSVTGSGEASSGPVIVRWRRAAGDVRAVNAEALVSGRVRARILVPVAAFEASPP
jgi:Tfp pilus assembly protein PilV